MKVLFIGGTGNISTSVSNFILKRGFDLYHFNRGNHVFNGVKFLKGNINNIVEAKKLLKDHTWDCVVNWINFTPDQVRRDIELFKDKTRQYIFISSASIYQKPLTNPFITESTPLYNPFWQYSRDKIACEDVLNNAYRDFGFPITIVRPSHTYDFTLPISLGGENSYTVIDRMLKKLPVVVHGDGTSLWVITHSKDFAKGFAGLVGNYSALGHAFHITTDEILTWNQIHETIGDVLGVELEIVNISSKLIAKHDENYYGTLIGDKSHSVIFDNSKIKKFVPEFHATIPFREGVRGTIENIMKNESIKVVNKDLNTFIDLLVEKYS